MTIPPAPPPAPPAPLAMAVVIPCYNAAEWIGRTLASVRDQGYPDLVLIVVDDGSTDGSVAAVQAFGAGVVVETGPNRGACHARNRGMQLAGEHGATHVVFLDADDHFEGDLLAGAAEAASRTGADMVLSHMHIQHYDGRREERFTYAGETLIAPETFFEGWMRGAYFNPSAILWRMGFVTDIGGWDERLSRAQDLDITLRAMFHAPRIAKNDRGAAIHARVNAVSVSQNVSRRATESRMEALLGLIRRAPGTSFAALVPLLNGELYSISRTAFRTGQTDLGRRGLRELAAQGYRRHPGTLPHRIAAGLLGLERKVRLWGG